MSVTSRNCIVRCRSLEEEYGLYTAKKDDIGIYNYQIEGNIGKLKSCLNGLLQEYGLTLTMKDEYIKEFCTYGAAEPCFLLGAAAQEAIKIIIKQFVIFKTFIIPLSITPFFKHLQLSSSNYIVEI
ncbi:NEDD8-activating enzyme E1 regulatory subunit-like isoform X2 [Xenopus laevis]|uniref:NEDD8-activating enzyme E1 regulatory subunit-like isoform X2 n=1 Tax=Xenopus laevis TaxID=8355 RepID=A0A8J1MXA1_XENLA|nr:NEDD8-activating enzyme E1 regulatory subunit-like isoform X2 [Xenopus laevis]